MKRLLPLLLCLSTAFVSAETSKDKPNESASASELSQFRNNAMDAIDNPYCRTLFKRYLKKQNPKAFLYITRAKERTAYCTHVTRKTMNDASKMVIARCEKKKKKSKKNKFTSPCRILASNHTLLLSRTDFGLKPHTKDLFMLLNVMVLMRLKKSLMLESILIKKIVVVLLHY